MRQIILDLGRWEVFGSELDLRVFGYGLMLVLGFLASVLLARWRAKRAGEEPETISQCAVLALIGGVLGARLLYVIRYREQFAEEGFWSILDISSGGLVYFGGLIGGAVLILLYMLFRRLPVRRFMDIIAPSLMLGLAFGRCGCLLNGCCWGGPARADFACHTRLPMVSRPLLRLDGDSPYAPDQGLCPAYAEQYGSGRVHPDERLLNAYARVRRVQPDGTVRMMSPPLPTGELHGPLRGEQLTATFATQDELRQRFDPLATDDGKLGPETWEADLREPGGLLAGSEHWSEAVAFDRPDSRGQPDGRLSFAEFRSYLRARRKLLLERFDADGDRELTGPERQAANDYLCADQFALLARQRTDPRLPAQLLGILNALILCGLLNLFYRHRFGEGRVLALMLVFYPITRFVLESIRSESPGGLLSGLLTPSQGTSIVLLLIGVLWWYIIGRLPASSGPPLHRRLDAHPPE